MRSKSRQATKGRHSIRRVSPLGGSFLSVRDRRASAVAKAMARAVRPRLCLSGPSGQGTVRCSITATRMSFGSPLCAVQHSQRDAVGTAAPREKVVEQVLHHPQNHVTILAGRGSALFCFTFLMTFGPPCPTCLSTGRRFRRGRTSGSCSGWPACWRPSAGCPARRRASPCLCSWWPQHRRNWSPRRAWC